MPLPGPHHRTLSAWHRLLGPLALLGLFLAGCASSPMTDEGLPEPVVTRSSTSTDWSTPQAAADAAAAARAPRRPPPATAPRPAAPSAAAPKPAAATPPPAPSPSAPPQAALEPPSMRLVYFDFDRFDIRGDFQALIEQHARWLAAGADRKLRVEGHADDRGGAEYNLALGQKRAQAVVSALVLLGVPEARLEAVSFGDTRPVDTGKTEEAFAKNRRAELIEH